MTDDIKAIRDALAAGPTPGPWHADLAAIGGEVFGFSIKAEHGTHWHPVTYQRTYQHTNSDCYTPAERAANAALIAACHPERIARLLDALEAAQRDADRIEWLNGAIFMSKWNGVLGRCSEVNWTIAGDWRHTCARMTGNDLRAAIDAAMSASAPQSPPADRAAGQSVSNPQR